MKKVFQGWSIWFGSALACHALLLFAIRPGNAAVPLAMGDGQAIEEITLVETAPAAETPPEPPAQPPLEQTQESPPPPEPDPLSEMAPLPIPEPAPIPVKAQAQPAPKPEPRRAVPQPLRSPRRPAAPGETDGPNSAASAFAARQARAGATGDSQLRPRYNPKPEYPAEARSAHQQGVVLVLAEVDAAGVPTSVRLSRSSGFPLLDAAALAAVRQWRFDPPRVAGIPVAGRAGIPVRFNLQNR